MEQAYQEKTMQDVFFLHLLVRSSSNWKNKVDTTLSAANRVPKGFDNKFLGRKKEMAGAATPAP